MPTEQAPQAGAPQETTPAPQMAAQAPTRPKAPGHPPAFGSAGGAAWIFRDLASI